MSHKWRVTGRRRSCAGYMAIGVAAVVVVGPPLSAQALVLDHGTSAGTVLEVKERQAPQRSAGKTGISLVVPIGRLSVGAELLDGEHTHVRRMTASGGMAIVEVSTTPFMPVLPSHEEARRAGRSIVRSDQPASW